MAQVQQLGALSLDRPQAPQPIRIKREDRAAYGVGGKGFFDQYSTFWYPGQALYFDDEPNLDFIPLNKLAYDRMQEFMDKLDALGLKKAKKDGKEYVPLPRQAWVDGAVNDELPTPQFVMAAKKDGSNEKIR